MTEKDGDKCVWQEDAVERFMTDCGYSFYDEWAAPLDLEFEHCPWCGKRMEPRVLTRAEKGYL